MKAKLAILNGADDFDFVCNYIAFIHYDLIVVKDEILKCTEFAVQNYKVIK